MSFRYNPLSGEFDYFTPPDNTAKILSDTKIADSNMSALTVVILTSSTNVNFASNDGSFSLSQAFGIITNVATVGNPVNVLFFGKVVDPFFNYPVNDSLYLGINGAITNIPPSLPLASHLTDIGYSLGTGSIFLNIQKPMIL